MLRYRVAAPSIRFVPWAALASCWPLPQQLLPVSAAGGGRRRCTLRINSGKNILNFAFGATAFAERSAAMKAPVGLLSGREVCVSRWSGFAPTSSAERSKRSFTGGVVAANGICNAAFCESAALRACPLPLGGAVAQRLRGSKSAEPEKTVKRSSRRTGVNLQFFPVGAHFFRIVKGEQPLARCGVGGVQR